MATAINNATTTVTAQATITTIAALVAPAAAENTSTVPAGKTEANVATMANTSTAIVSAKSRVVYNPPPPNASATGEKSPTANSVKMFNIRLGNNPIVKNMLCLLCLTS